MRSVRSLGESSLTCVDASDVSSRNRLLCCLLSLLSSRSAGLAAVCKCGALAWVSVRTSRVVSFLTRLPLPYV